LAFFRCHLFVPAAIFLGRRLVLFNFLCPVSGTRRRWLSRVPLSVLSLLHLAPRYFVSLFVDISLHLAIAGLLCPLLFLRLLESCLIRLDVLI
jgi:hypothetical protein